MDNIDIDLLASWLFFVMCFAGLLMSTIRLIQDFCKKQDDRINNIYNNIEEIIHDNSWHDYKKEKPSKGNIYLFAKYDNLSRTIVYQVGKYNNIQYDKTYKILAWKHIEEYIPEEECNV